jgi:hypothetical protein
MKKTIISLSALLISISANNIGTIQMKEDRSKIVQKPTTIIGCYLKSDRRYNKINCDSIKEQSCGTDIKLDKKKQYKSKTRILDARFYSCPDTRVIEKVCIVNNKREDCSFVTNKCIKPKLLKAKKYFTPVKILDAKFYKCEIKQEIKERDICLVRKGNKQTQFKCIDLKKQCKSPKLTKAKKYKTPFEILNAKFYECNEDVVNKCFVKKGRDQKEVKCELVKQECEKPQLLKAKKYYQKNSILNAKFYQCQTKEIEKCFVRKGRSQKEVKCELVKQECEKPQLLKAKKYVRSTYTLAAKFYSCPLKEVPVCFVREGYKTTKVDCTKINTKCKEPKLTKEKKYYKGSYILAAKFYNCPVTWTDTCIANGKITDCKTITTTCKNAKEYKSRKTYYNNKPTTFKFFKCDNKPTYNVCLVDNKKIDCKTVETNTKCKIATKKVTKTKYYTVNYNMYSCNTSNTDVNKFDSCKTIEGKEISCVTAEKTCDLVKQYKTQVNRFFGNKTSKNYGIFKCKTVINDKDNLLANKKKCLTQKKIWTGDKCIEKKEITKCSANNKSISCDTVAKNPQCKLVDTQKETDEKYIVSYKEYKCTTSTRKAKVCYMNNDKVDCNKITRNCKITNTKVTNTEYHQYFNCTVEKPKKTMCFVNGKAEKCDSAKINTNSCKIVGEKKDVSENYIIYKKYYSCVTDIRKCVFSIGKSTEFKSGNCDIVRKDCKKIGEYKVQTRSGIVYTEKFNCPVKDVKLVVPNSPNS